MLSLYFKGLFSPIKPGERQTLIHFNNAEIVCLSAFEMDRHEVTNVEYAECVAKGGCTTPGASTSFLRGSYYGNVAYDNFPVVYMTWAAADDYCSWAGKRLPTDECPSRAGERRESLCTRRLLLYRIYGLDSCGHAPGLLPHPRKP